MAGNPRVRRLISAIGITAILAVPSMVATSGAGAAPTKGVYNARAAR